MTAGIWLAIGCLVLAPASPEHSSPGHDGPGRPTVSFVSRHEAKPDPQPAADEDQGPTVHFKLLGKAESVTPCKHGDGEGDGQISVESEDNQLKVVLGEAAGANVFLGVESRSTATVQLVQEFEISCSDPTIRQVPLTLEAHLGGFLRTKHKASAGLKLARVTITPVGRPSTPLALNFTPEAVQGPNGCNGGPKGLKFDASLNSPRSLWTPIGRYVLQASLELSATAGGLLDAHSMAMFMAESEALDPWEREHDPFKGDSHESYGFTLTLKLDPPSSEGEPLAHNEAPTP